MLSRRSTNKDSQNVKFLKRLEEDLRVLETSWLNKNLHPKRVVRHFEEIIDSVAEITRTEGLDPAETICADLKEYLASVAGGHASLGERSWMTALELIDLVSDSLRSGSEASSDLEKLHTRWAEEALLLETAMDETPDSPGRQSRPSWEGFGESEVHNPEESEMTDISKMDPQELLLKAQKALSSGDGEGAKEMALKAAEMIARIEAEERKKREKALQSDLEAVAREESELEQSIYHTKEKIAGREKELGELTERLSQAQAALDEREAASREIRREIDETEAEMTAIKEKHKQLLDRFQEVLPARDAAERECTRIKGEYGELPAQIESLRDDLQGLELQMEQIRQRKAETEAELARISEEIAV